MWVVISVPQYQVLSHLVWGEVQVLEIFQISWMIRMAKLVNLQARDSVTFIEDSQLELDLSFL